MGGYLEKGAKAVIDMQEELRTPGAQALLGLPVRAPPTEAAADEKPRPRRKAAAAKKPRAKKK